MADETNYGAGSGIADALQTILARKQLLSRQAMLDDLNRRNVESEMSARAENAASQKAEREAVAEDRKEAARIRLAGTLPMGQRLDPSTAARLDPSWVNPAEGPPSPEENMGVPKSLAEVGEYDKPTFAGMPVQQDEAKRELMLQNLHVMYPDFEKKSPMEQFLIIRKIDPKGTIPASLFTQQQTHPNGVYLRQPNGNITLDGKVVKAADVPYGAKVLNPYQAPGSVGSFGVFPEINPTNQMPTGRYFKVDNHSGRIAPADLPAPPKPGEQPVQSTPNPNAPSSIKVPRAPQGAAGKPYDEQAYNTFQVTDRNPNATDEAKSGAKWAFIKTIQPQSVRDDITAIMQDPQMKAAKIDALMPTITPPPDWQGKPEDYATAVVSFLRMLGKD